VILGKPFYHTVGIVIARTPVPAFVDIIGSRLYSTEGNAGADKGMTMTAGTDIGIYEAKETGFPDRQACGGFLPGRSGLCVKVHGCKGDP